MGNGISFNVKNVSFLRGLNCLVFYIFFLKNKTYWVFFIIKAIHIDFRIVDSKESKRRIESLYFYNLKETTINI